VGRTRGLGPGRVECGEPKEDPCALSMVKQATEGGGVHMQILESGIEVEVRDAKWVAPPFGTPSPTLFRFQIRSRLLERERVQLRLRRWFQDASSRGRV
jgi:hypothetical protein